jgi:hypothetical protein
VSDRRAVAFALVAALWLLGLELLGIGAVIAYRPRRRAAPRATAVPTWARLQLMPRGGRLVGAALAGRGPPLAPNA